MTKLAIDPSELYSRQDRPVPPPIGSPLRAWSAYRALAPRIAPSREPKQQEARKRRKAAVVVDDAFLARMTELCAQFPDPKVAEMMGCHILTVRRWRKRLGLKSLFKSVKGGSRIQVPGWVPTKYEEPFRARARRRGFAIAEKWVRCRMLGLYVPGPKKGDKKARHTFLLNRVLAECARWFGMSVGDITGPCREHKYVVPRHIAVGLAKQLTGRGLPWIGERFGGRDHTTILNSLERFRQLNEADSPLSKAIAEIRSRALSPA